MSHETPQQFFELVPSSTGQGLFVRFLESDGDPWAASVGDGRVIVAAPTVRAINQLRRSVPVEVIRSALHRRPAVRLSAGHDAACDWGTWDRLRAWAWRQDSPTGTGT